MKYKVRTIRGRHQYVQVDFEDEKYNLVGEMLMAEKSFLQQIIKMLESVTGSDDKRRGSGSSHKGAEKAGEGVSEAVWENSILK